MLKTSFFVPETLGNQILLTVASEQLLVTVA